MKKRKEEILPNKKQSTLQSIEQSSVQSTTQCSVQSTVQSTVQPNVKSPKASLDAMDIMKLAGGIMSGVLVKDYAVYKKWIKEWYNKHFMTLLRTIKLHDTIG